MGGLEGFGALVTGGGGGIGLGCAKRLAADGAAVTVVGRTDATLRDAITEIDAVAAAGTAPAQHVVADVTDEQQVADTVERAAETTGTLDVVLACAGGNTSVGPIGQLDTDAWRASLELNATGTMLTLKHGSRALARDRGGSFVAISSIASSNTHRWFGAYGPSKAAVDHLVALGADELGPAGIRVNGIRPGLVATDMVQDVTAPGPVLDDYLACMPLGRVGQVEDIAEAARFFAGPESSWVTGQVVNVDGGHHLRRGPDYRPMFGPLFGEAALDGQPPQQQHS